MEVLPVTRDDQESVVLVYNHSATWVGMAAEVIRSTGRAVGLVTGPLTQQDADRFDGLADRTVTVDDPTDADQLAKAANTAADGRRVGAVLGMSDAVVVPAARAAQRLGVGRTPAAGLALARNKYAARQAMHRAGLPVPNFALLHDATQAADVADQVGLPAVLKPVNGTGSHLVEPVHTVAELEAAYRKVAARLLDAAPMRQLYAGLVDTDPADSQSCPPIDPTSTFLVEGMLRGPEYLADVVIQDGRAEPLPLVDKVLVDDRYFERIFACPPLALDEPGRQRVTDCLIGAVRALGLDNTVAHVEVIDDAERGPTVVEVNARPGGPPLGVLYDLHTGVNTAAEQITAALGLPSQRTEPRLPIPLGLFIIFPPASGRLRAVHGLDELEQLPEAVQLMTTVSPGDVLTTDYEIIAVNLIVAGLTERADLEQVYAEAADLVRFEVDPA